MTDKLKVYARLNWGNWIADCPIHGEGVAEGVEPGKDFICSRCHPGIHASMRMRFKGQLVNVPDLAARGLALKEAERAGHVYEVVFPDDMKQILEAVRPRKVQHMNWRPRMTIADLEHENEEHGVN